MEFDSHIRTCVDDAHKAGFDIVDVYAFLCPRCSGNNPPASAIDKIIDNLKDVKYNVLWLDVEQCSGCWDSDAANRDFISKAAKAAEAKKVKVGIYSSTGEWASTVGSWTELRNLPLWYAHYDGRPSFDDWPAMKFGGWDKPTMKQYGDSGPCASVDVDWYPDGMLHPGTNITLQ